MRLPRLLEPRNVLLFSVVAEGATGALAVLAPGLVAQLLFGAEVSGAGVAYGRLLGMTLIALAIACWPGAALPLRPAVRAMLTYNTLAALYLAYLAILQPAGILIWPAAAEHALVTLLLISAREV
ncbi:MAG TPA: hypothetical protein VF110_02295 [Burkholderiales bacterium]|jgi:hypothetical protein